MRYVLKRKGFSQIPQLTSSKPMNIDQNFYLVPKSSMNTGDSELIIYSIVLTSYTVRTWNRNRKEIGWLVSGSTSIMCSDVRMKYEKKYFVVF